MNENRITLSNRVYPRAVPQQRDSESPIDYYGRVHRFCVKHSLCEKCHHPIEFHYPAAALNCDGRPYATSTFCHYVDAALSPYQIQTELQQHICHCEQYY